MDVNRHDEGNLAKEPLTLLSDIKKNFFRFFFIHGLRGLYKHVS